MTKTKTSFWAWVMFALAVIVCGCDSCLPESFRATPKAGFERMAAAKLQNCVQNNPCQFLRQCFEESSAYCVDAGYSPRCGQMEAEGTCGQNLRVK